MRIRGLGTLSNGEVSNPLIVVDGVPMDDISFLDTQDIENISVLKDASASSIYGTRRFRCDSNQYQERKA